MATRYFRRWREKGPGSQDFEQAPPAGNITRDEDVVLVLLDGYPVLPDFLHGPVKMRLSHAEYSSQA